ncbi:hypothetical protein Hanom_Chr15g01387621 [Helianthus anomalus]
MYLKISMKPRGRKRIYLYENYKLSPTKRKVRGSVAPSRPLKASPMCLPNKIFWVVFLFNCLTPLLP